MRLTPERSGVYGVGPGKAGYEPAAAGTISRFDADFGRVRDKAGLTRTVAAATGFPGDFGENWDALADALQDLSWRTADAYVLHVRNNRRACRALGDGWGTFLEILATSALYWKARGKTFVALIEDAPGLPQWT